jgi:putative endopeptidase
MTGRRLGCIAVLLLNAFAASPLGAQGSAQVTALSRSNMDTTCSACVDFYQYANGGWMRRTTIPASYGSFSGFRELRDRNQEVLHDILTSTAERMRSGALKKSSPEWKVGAFYASCMDTTAIDRRGMTPLRDDLRTIAAIHRASELTRAIGILERSAGVAPWADASTQDSRDAANTIAGLYQGGLTLPNNEYYTKNDSGSVAIREKYVAHMARMFALLGDSPTKSTAEAQRVLAFETRLARASRTPVELRDPVANYHRMTLAQVESLTPHFSWTTFYRTLGTPAVERVDVGQPEFFRAVDTMLTTVPVEDWKTYLRWRVAHVAAPSLSTAFVREDFTYQQIFSGATELLPRWKRCANATDNQLGELLGQEYVKRTFTPEAKARAVAIVDNLVRALRGRIEQLDWMSAATKSEALVKLDAFTRKIGYPDKWRDYSALHLAANDYFANLQAASQWAAQRDWRKIGRPTDRTEWGMSPPTVNAYENPLLNEIVFPAGILQPPFFDPNADDAVNYGAMGAVIGHEMSHAFDDQGRQYDKAGNLRDWWTADDARKYNAEAQRIVEQFNGYTVLDTATHVNGRLTLGENIGDFGGLTVAYAAMERAIGPGPHPRIDGFTPEQRFFLGWAQVWREVARPEALRWQVNSNEHSPSVWRVNGPLSNMPEFRAAWGCLEGDPMVRSANARPRIW